MRFEPSLKTPNLEGNLLPQFFLKHLKFILTSSDQLSYLSNRFNHLLKEQKLSIAIDSSFADVLNHNLKAALSVGLIEGANI